MYLSFNITEFLGFLKSKKFNVDLNIIRYLIPKMDIIKLDLLDDILYLMTDINTLLNNSEFLHALFKKGEYEIFTYLISKGLRIKHVSQVNIEILLEPFKRDSNLKLCSFLISSEIPFQKKKETFHKLIEYHSRTRYYQDIKIALNQL